MRLIFVGCVTLAAGFAGEALTGWFGWSFGFWIWPLFALFAATAAAGGLTVYLGLVAMSPDHASSGENE